MLLARHLTAQGKVLAALGSTVVEAAGQRLGIYRPRPAPVLPGPEVTAEITPPPAALVRDYLRHVGGDPSAYRGVLPPHLFPQWAVPLAARTLRGLPYPMLEVVNGGCRLRMNAPLPAQGRLLVRARLESIEDDGRRAVLHQRVVTGTAAAPEALVADLYVIVPAASRARSHARDDQPGDAAARKPRPRVPADADELAFWRLRADAGLDFGLLTGDLNPIHWVRPYARAAGFRAPVLHGFSALARAIEGLQRARFSGSTSRLVAIDVRFVRPLALPARVGLYTEDHALFVGDAPGGPAYVTGSFEERPS